RRDAISQLAAERDGCAHAGQRSAPRRCGRQSGRVFTVRVMLYVFGVDTMHAFNLGLPTAYFVSITIVVASIIALSKDDLKARLAYSTVSQLSYIILGVALMSDAGIQGGVIHIA